MTGSHWTVRSEAPLYRDEWLDIRLANVETPAGPLDHRVIRTGEGAGALVVDRRDRALLIWRHRFITDSWGWEIPAGGVEAHESPAEAAAREVEEETGWRPGPMRPLLYTEPNSGIADTRHHVFRADEATFVGPPTETGESERVEWVPLASVPHLIGTRAIVSGTTIAALLLAQCQRPAVRPS
ncbi:NUDIX domain-containing protein [Actinomadura opuntiae]|uniref:NUDIX domain-containing protein n=1 Tax=Actinomadura sp. OS1-43 TaxID=604315 RepID=UPI00255A778C|nr:NUDIX domain-containing protein [Actinomadura sp. OS1-43]MDL4815410.1 NUDIX domain-containing protein [Actinomadura sp. OS1-43]